MAHYVARCVVYTKAMDSYIIAPCCYIGLHAKASGVVLSCNRVRATQCACVCFKDFLDPCMSLIKLSSSL